MDRDELSRRLRQTFAVELDELVRQMGSDLLELEKHAGRAGDPEALENAHRLFRAAHSLKGGARAVALAPVERVCHYLEEFLAQVRDGARTLDRDAFAVLFAAVDALGEARADLEAAGPDAGAALAEVTESLAALAGAAAPAAHPGAPVLQPTPADADDPRRRAGDPTMRVSARALDAAVGHSGELLVARAHLGLAVAELGGVHAGLARWRADLRRAGAEGADDVRDRVEGAERQMAQLSRRLGDLNRRSDQLAELIDADLRQLRMLPFAEACLGLERTVRDLAAAGGKQVELAIDGADVELDRDIVEALRAPLLHLVRNAVDHGVEPLALRRAADKPEQARIEVAARLLGSEVEVSVGDDGAGLDDEAIAASARRRGLALPASPDDLLRLAFAPGVSTARAVTDVSGRGVGLDVVRSHVEAHHGTVAVQSARGRGARFTLTVPITLTSMRALLVAASGQVFALATTSVRRVIRFAPREVGAVQGRSVLPHGGRLVPIASLAGVLGLPETPPPSDRMATAVLIRSSAGDVALIVDEALAEQLIVTRPLGARVIRSRSMAGITFLSHGQLALVLRAGDLARAAIGMAGSPVLGRPAAESAARRRRILVVDDSLTTRTLVRTILEAVGYEVAVADDGAQAWRILEQRGADLIVSDVEMPGLDGLGLTEAVKSSPRHGAVPVVLVTALGSDRERARGLAAGADAYLVKSTFDQTHLLETIEQLLGGPT
jgi:two-component system chemotaxis sensor kinase CheA